MLSTILPGRDPAQGPFGRDMSVMNPGWARWFDALKDAGVDKIGGAGPDFGVSAGGLGETQASPRGFGYSQRQLPEELPGTAQAFQQPITRQPSSAIQGLFAAGRRK